MCPQWNTTPTFFPIQINSNPDQLEDISALGVYLWTDLARSTATRSAMAERFAARAGFSGMLAVLVPLDPVEIEPPVGQVAHSALRSCPLQVGEIDVADSQRLDILGRLGRDTIAREREIARRQNAALGVLNVHVPDIGEIADVAG